jgi:predicted RNA binding protein YcfA (HicA-like mRNA interferase family)
LKALSGKQLARLLENRGWALLRINGSHHIYGISGSITRISIPIHGNSTLKMGLQRHLMKLAGIPESDL